MRKSPEEFALWLAGAVDTSPGCAPTQEQWAKIREELAQTVGGVMKERMLREQERENMRAIRIGQSQPQMAPSMYYGQYISTGTGLPAVAGAAAK